MSTSSWLKLMEVGDCAGSASSKPTPVPVASPLDRLNLKGGGLLPLTKGLSVDVVETVFDIEFVVWW